MKEIAEKCWNEDPEQRPSIQLVSEEFFAALS